jgi:hypothetical protein
MRIPPAGARGLPPLLPHEVAPTPAGVAVGLPTALALGLRPHPGVFDWLVKRYHSFPLGCPR